MQMSVTYIKEGALQEFIIEKCWEDPSPQLEKAPSRDRIAWSVKY